MESDEIVLITGATGFLGSEVFARLTKIFPMENLWLLVRRQPTLDAGLFSLRLQEKKIHDLFPKIRSFILNFEDAKEFQSGLRNLPLQKGQKFRILHLAALIHASSSEKEKQDRVNVGVTEDLLDFAIEKKCEHFVYSSSVVAFGGTFDARVRTEKDFPQFPEESLHHNYFFSKREAHEALAKRASSVALSLLCPAIVHGSLEQFKSSRSHLKALREGRLSVAPGGGSNFVGLDRAAQAFADALAQKPPELDKPQLQLLVDENLSYRDYFQLYVDLYAEIRGQKSRKIWPIPAFISWAAFRLDKGLKALSLPEPDVLAGLAQARLHLYFDSEFPLPPTIGLRESLRLSLKGL